MLYGQVISVHPRWNTWRMLEPGMWSVAEPSIDKAGRGITQR